MNGCELMQQNNISFTVPKDLLEVIEKRARINGRKRNQELRYLLAIGLDLAAGGDIKVQLSGSEWVRSIGRIHPETRELLDERAQTFQRSVGLEIVRLVAYAIEESARRDLQVITEMLSRQGSAAPSG